MDEKCRPQQVADSRDGCILRVTDRKSADDVRLENSGKRNYLDER